MITLFFFTRKKHNAAYILKKNASNSNMYDLVLEVNSWAVYKYALWYISVLLSFMLIPWLLMLHGSG